VSIVAITLKADNLVPDSDEISTGRDHSRDDFQKQIDAEVATLVKLWHEQGDQEIGKGAPTKRYVVSTDDRAEMRKVIERAFTLASKDLSPKIGPAWYTSKVNGGTVALKFTAKYLPVPVKAAPAAPAANGQAAPQADQPQADQPNPAADQGGDTPQAAPADSGRRGFRRQ
jgi:hypothetical protein